MTSCLSSKRSKPTELIPQVSVGVCVSVGVVIECECGCLCECGCVWRGKNIKFLAYLLSCASKSVDMKRIASILILIMAVSMAMQAQSTKVLLKTTMGDITVMLYDDTPMHRDNFIKLVNDKFYDGLLFHRVMNGFMIQTGDPGSKNAGPDARLGSGGPGYKVPAEFRPNHWHKKGALAAARQGDQFNPKKESSGSQFYIVQGKKWSPEQLDMLESQGRPEFTEEQRKHYTQVGGYAPLDFQYTVFGEVTDGLDVIDKIAAVEVDRANRPVKDVKIISATVVK